jgi:hypothetical protein
VKVLCIHAIRAGRRRWSRGTSRRVISKGSERGRRRALGRSFDARRRRVSTLLLHFHRREPRTKISITAITMIECRLASARRRGGAEQE